MMKQYITIRHIEELLKNLPLLEALLKNLQLEEQTIYSLGQGEFADSNMLYSAGVGNRVMTDLPRSTDIAPGDKELKIITNINKNYANLLKELHYEITIIGELIEKVNNSLNGLTDNQRYILKEFYKEGTSRKTWKQIAAALKIGVTVTKEERTNALKKISQVLRVDYESYEFCLKTLDMSQIRNANSDDVKKG